MKGTRRAGNVSAEQVWFLQSEVQSAKACACSPLPLRWNVTPHDFATLSWFCRNGDGVDQNLFHLYPCLMEWTSICQLFWESPGVLTAKSDSHQTRQHLPAVHHEDGSPLSLGVWLLDVARCCGNLCSEHDEYDEKPLDFGVPNCQPKPNIAQAACRGVGTSHPFSEEQLCWGEKPDAWCVGACNPGKIWKGCGFWLWVSLSATPRNGT